jgi:hypothetical protein
MNSEKRARLPRGLHWREDSPYIRFTRGDPRGKQHRQSTQTADPLDAALCRLQFMKKAEERFEELTSPRASYGKLPLHEVADLYFKQKAIDHATSTIARERRIFRRVEQYFGPDTTVRSIHLWFIEQYQQERSTEIRLIAPCSPRARASDQRAQGTPEARHLLHPWNHTGAPAPGQTLCAARRGIRRSGLRHGQGVRFRLS